MPRKTPPVDPAPERDAQPLHITTKDGTPVAITPEGSLPLLALGYRGLMAWRAERARSGKEPPPPHTDEQA